MRNEDAYPYTFCQEESTTSRGGNQPPGGDQVTFISDMLLKM